MKNAYKGLGAFLTVLTFICDAAEFLAVPFLIVICGMLSLIPSEYCIGAILAYFLLFALIELVLYLLSRLFGKRINSFVTRKLEKYFSSHEKEIDVIIEKCEPIAESIANTFTSDKTNSNNTED